MQASKLLTIAAVITAFGTLGAPARAAETAADIPENAYYNDPLTGEERSGIAQEENVSPNDGRASVPPAQDDGVIPDAAVDQRQDAKADPAKAGAKKPGESEAEVVLDDAKKNDKVSKRNLADCVKDWDPQTQMSKAEWTESCRTTLEYFPDGQ